MSTIERMGDRINSAGEQAHPLVQSIQLRIRQCRHQSISNRSWPGTSIRMRTHTLRDKSGLRGTQRTWWDMCADATWCPSYPCGGIYQATRLYWDMFIGQTVQEEIIRSQNLTYQKRYVCKQYFSKYFFQILYLGSSGRRYLRNIFTAERSSQKVFIFAQKQTFKRSGFLPLPQINQKYTNITSEQISSI